MAAAGKHYGLVQLADLGPAVPSLEAAHSHFRAAGWSPYEMASVLAPLALAGYYADRRLAGRYGPEAVDVLQTIVGLKLARRLRAYLGRRLALLVALGVAAFGFARRSRNPRTPTFREAIMLLFNCVAALTGVCTICIDPEGAKRYASVLEPMTAFGPDHVATFMHEFCLNLVATVEDRLGESRARWSAHDRAARSAGRDPRPAAGRPRALSRRRALRPRRPGVLARRLPGSRVRRTPREPEAQALRDERRPGADGVLREPRQLRALRAIPRARRGARDPARHCVAGRDVDAEWSHHRVPADAGRAPA